MPALIFDIETVGEDFAAMDETTQGNLSRWIERDARDEKEKKRLTEQLKDGLGFSPLTGKIVAVGVYDGERKKGAVFFEPAPKEPATDFEEGEFKFEALSEKEILTKFWDIATKYDTFVSFNGRGFDVPFLAVRSAVHSIRPSKNLLSNRYLSSQAYGAKHIDLQDQLTFYGASQRRGSLHLWCRAFGIESPKAQGVDGDDVKMLYEDGKGADIARYNARDLRATYALYQKYTAYLQF